ncbi:glutamate--tRNA ligase [Chamaesiphon sp. OTE_75_metabat_556]|uniref:glutamate--tRNA ligase n=1 Tax=Chamaesiphon sp. OTE_75_metabat_556 TaxID=2964692 RepID=UPI00286C9E06|nr:glutamate--tRNA ligase [Chamaesiphon sp. OTE_75_metabat_556]
MTVRVRIAPSPTGNLHIGTARTAVFNWLFAHHHQGKFILRIEDTDLERSKSEYTQNILDGLKWLGLNWDEGPLFQSQRLDLYRQSIQTLLANGSAYRCYTTTAELDELRATQEANHQAPRYDNRHRNLTPEQEAAFIAAGRRPVIRFKIEDEREISWLDLVRDTVTWKGSDLGGDMVISRAADEHELGQPLYNLAVVVDDIDMKITHVIRGEDHIANTAKQILLYEGLGVKVPEFAHTPLILSAEGKKLSKRDGVTSIDDFKQMGYIAPALVNYMTLLGWSAPDAQELFTLDAAANQFDFERVNKAGGKFDWDKLNWINSQYIHAMSAEQLLPELIPYWQAAGFEFDPDADRAWLLQLTSLIGASLARLDECVEISRTFFTDSVTLNEEAAAKVTQPGAKEVLASLATAIKAKPDLNESEVQELIKQVTKEQNVKKGLVMQSLRAALTGEVHGSDLIQSILLLHQHQLAVPRIDRILG